MKYPTIMKLATPLLLSALIGLGGCIVPRFDPECPETSDCDECIKDDGCGFCSNESGSGVCVPGSGLGPDDVSACAPQRWRIGDCYSTPDWAECDHYSCSTCVEHPECGYSNLTEECWPIDQAPESLPLVTNSEECSW